MKPELFSQLVGQYLVPSKPGQTLTRAIEIFADTEQGPPALFDLLETNPAYSLLILNQKALAQKITQWSEENPGRADQEAFLSKRALGLLGKTATRNLIAAIRLARVTGEGLPRKKEDALGVSVQKQLALALQTEALCLEQSWAYPEMGFIGGLHYDWLSSLFAKRKVSEEGKTALRKSYQQGLWIARHAYKLSQSIKGIQYARFVFAGALTLPIGHALGTALFPKGGAETAWSASASESEKFGKMRAEAALHFQKKTYGFTYNELTAFYIESMDFLKEITPAVRFYHEPWQLGPKQNAQYQLALILSVSATLAEVKEVKPDMKLPLKGFQKQWLKKSGLSEASVLKNLVALRADAKK